VRPRVCGACGNDVPRGSVLLFLCPLNRISLFGGGCFFDHDRSIHPTLSFPREFPRWVCHVSTCVVSECPTPFYGGEGVGGIFRFTNLDDPRESFVPSAGRAKKKKIYPLDFPRDSISRNAIARRHQERVEDEGNDDRPDAIGRARGGRFMTCRVVRVRMRPTRPASGAVVVVVVLESPRARSAFS